MAKSRKKKSRKETKVEEPSLEEVNSGDDDNDESETPTQEVKQSKSKRKRSDSVAESEHDEENKDEDNEPKEVNEDEDGEKEEPSKRKRKRKRKKKNAASASDSGTVDDITQILSPESNASAQEIRQAQAKLSNQEVFVEGLPFDCSEDEVKDFFVQGGCPDVIQMRLPRWQDSGRLRGYGHIVFSSPESRQKAINNLSGKNLKKRYITIVPSKQPRSTQMQIQDGDNTNTNDAISQPKNCCTVFVKNLPYDVSESELEDIFRPFGKLPEQGGAVRLALNSITRKPKGFGYVQFQHPEGAYAAVKKSREEGGGIAMRGRILFVDFEERGMKNSFRTRDGKLWNKEHTAGGNNGERQGRSGGNTSFQRGGFRR